VAGTATAVSGRVQRRQAEKYADRDAQIYADREQAYEQQTQPETADRAPTETDVIAQLQQLGKLRDDGVLTEEEFAAQKARILGS
jgi:Short C-terminal domain